MIFLVLRSLLKLLSIAGNKCPCQYFLCFSSIDHKGYICPSAVTLPVIPVGNQHMNPQLHICCPQMTAEFRPVGDLCHRGENAATQVPGCCNQLMTNQFSQTAGSPPCRIWGKSSRESKVPGISPSLSWQCQVPVLCLSPCWRSWEIPTLALEDGGCSDFPRLVSVATPASQTPWSSVFLVYIWYVLA